MLCGLADGFGALMMSTTLGFTSNALLSMAKDPDFEITEEEGSWIGAIVPGAALLGSLAASRLVDSYGRKRIILAISFPTMLSWLSIALSTTPAGVFMARFFSGILLGIQQVAISVYISETVDPKLRPNFGVYPAFLAIIGFVIVNLQSDWRGLAKLGCTTCLPLLLLISYLPESPYYLVKKGRKEDSYSTLKWLRGDDKMAAKEMKELETTAVGVKEITLTLKDMFQPPNRWPICISILLMVFQQGTGISALTTFMGTLFESVGSLLDSRMVSILTAVTNIASFVYTAKLFAKYQRKIFIKYSSLVIMASLLVLAIYVTARESSGVFRTISEYFTIIPGLAFITYTIGFTIGWGPIPWMFIGDGIPANIKGEGAAIVVAASWIFNFLVTKSFLWLTASLGTPGLLIMYLVFTLVGMLTMTSYLPETFGFTPSQIDQYYAGAYQRASYKSKRK